MTLTRRIALLSAASLGLAGCTAASSLTPAQAVSDLQTFGTALVNATNEIAPGTIPAATTTAIAQSFSQAQTVANTLTPGLTAASDATGAQKVIDYVNDAFAILANPPVDGLIPPPLSTVIAAVDVLLPGIESLLTTLFGAAASTSLVAGALHSKAVAVRTSARASALDISTVAQARAVLATYAKAHN
ncbi:hypothetical protein [Acidisphaera sp. S103]|uniref:hypothetical protein n=1 Tax=Acidisphaera sp. S103 TaxID=1747223 RepID=UPI00131B7F34|nr:hypothetical protein [Acidisphaera sp. S103]